MCQRYIELNPVRAGMTDHPGAYRWSSYGTNAQRTPSSLITAHPQYLALGDNHSSRQPTYRELFRYPLDPEMIDQIRTATNSNYALGHPRFQTQVAKALGRRVTPGKSGRPPKSHVPESLDLFNTNPN